MNWSLYLMGFLCVKGTASVTIGTASVKIGTASVKIGTASVKMREVTPSHVTETSFTCSLVIN